VILIFEYFGAKNVEYLNKWINKTESIKKEANTSFFHN
jgi:hypothetical protein